jgi:hypothetical protein
MRRFDWTEYARVAGDLAQHDDEAYPRTAISRLYYSVYWRARKQLEKEGHDAELRNSFRSHDLVWQYFYVDPAPFGETIGAVGNKLKRQRHQADYVEQVVITGADWREALGRAKILNEFVDTL